MSVSGVLRAEPAPPALVLAMALLSACARAASVGAPLPGDDPLTRPIACGACEEWNRPAAPVRVFGNTYWVGVEGLTVVLLTSPAGHALIDGGLPQSVARIEASVRALGFRVEDIRLLLNSHAHFDHAGGLAALARRSGAQVVASPAGARALEAGRPGDDDPQPASGAFPAVTPVRGIGDGQAVELGPLRLTAHHTAGHTPGSTSWTWRSCQGEGPSALCLDLVLADSLNPISDEGFRFSDVAHPERVPTFERSIARVAALPCDILLTVHPGLGGLAEKRARVASGRGDAFVDPGACRAYADEADRRLTARLLRERSATAALPASAPR